MDRVLVRTGAERVLVRLPGPPGPPGTPGLSAEQVDERIAGHAGETSGVHGIPAGQAVATAGDVGAVADAAASLGARLLAVETDGRWSDAREPLPHAASHAAGGGDPVSPESIGAAPAHGHPFEPAGAVAAEAAARAAADALLVPLGQRGAPAGVATLDGTGRVPADQLPAIAITARHVVDDEAAMLALAAQEGDVAIRTDLPASFILGPGPSDDPASWSELLSPLAAVSSVNGRVGDVNLDDLYDAAGAAAGAVAGIPSGGAADVPALRTLGHGAGQAMPGDDPSRTDARAPLPHAASHAGGEDPLTAAMIGAAGADDLASVDARLGAVEDDPRWTDQRVPVDGSVTAPKIPDGTLTASKMAFDPATQAELDAVAQQVQAPNVAVEGVPLYAYGHSVVQGQSGTSHQPWVNRVAVRERLGVVGNRGEGGERMEQTLTRMLNDAARKWVPGTSGIAVVQAALNDVRMLGGNALGLDGFANSLRSALACLTAGSKIENTAAAVAYSPVGWTHDADSSIMSDRTASYTNAVESWVDVTFNGDSATLLLIGTAPALSINGAVAEISLRPSGAVLRVVNCDDRCASDTSGSPGAPQACHLPVTVSGLGPGAHTVRIRKTDISATAYMWFDVAYVPSPNPPTVVVVKDYPLNAAGWAGYAPYNQGSDAALAAYNAVVDQVVAEFPYAVSVDAGAGWDPATMLHPDNVHANDRGMAHIATRVGSALRGMGWRSGLNIL